MVTCPRCGAENKEGRRACWNCWSSLTADDAPSGDAPAALPEPLAKPDLPPERAAADATPRPELAPTASEEAPPRQPEELPGTEGTTTAYPAVTPPDKAPPLPADAGLPPAGIPKTASSHDVPRALHPIGESTEEAHLAKEAAEQPEYVGEAEGELAIEPPAEAREEKEAAAAEAPEDDPPDDDQDDPPAAAPVEDQADPPVTEAEAPPADVADTEAPAVDAPAPEPPADAAELRPELLTADENLDPEPLPSNSYIFVAEPAVRASRRGEWWLLGITAVLALLIVGVILVWYVSFRAQPRVETPAEVAQAYLNALTTGNRVEQAQFATLNSKSRRLPGGWLTVNTASLTGELTVQGGTASAPLSVALIITLPSTDPGVPPVPETTTCTLALPLVRESGTWRVDQTGFFRNIRDALATAMPGKTLPAWN